MANTTRRPQGLEDLGYELRLLLGADEIVKFIEKHDSTRESCADKFGNVVNYFKDSAYLHSRNLLNALTNGYPTEIGNIPSAIRSDLFGDLKDSLERYVLHVNQARDQRGTSNIIRGRHLNECVGELAEEVQRCWTEWIDKTSDPAHKQKLQESFDAATESAHNDRKKLQQLVKG